MNKHTMPGLSLLLFSSLLSAKSVTWQVKPTVCVNQKPGEACEMQIAIELNRAIKDDNCLYFESSLLECWPDNKTDHELTLRFASDGSLKLVHVDGETLQAQALTIKSREPVKKRRRVRQPWSLF